MLRKRFYPYECMDDWEKKNFIAIMEDIADADYMHGKRVCKDFEIKNLGECHDLYFKSNTLPFVDAFENFRKMLLKISELDLAKCLSAPGLARQAILTLKRVRGSAGVQFHPPVVFPKMCLLETG